MKILFCSHHFFPDVGGIEVNSEILASRFSKAGHSIILLTWTPATAMDVFSFPVVRKPSWPELIKLHKWADLVFENNPCLRLAWPQLFFNSKNVVALNTWVARIDGKIAWQDKLKKWWLSQADAVISVSKALAAKAWKEALVIANPYRHELLKTRRIKEPMEVSSF